MPSKTYPVICVGSTSKDIFLPTDEGRILETPEDIISKRKAAFEIGGKYRVPDRYEAVGGVAANIAQALALLGVEAAVMSRIGDDEMGRWILREFGKRGVPTDLVQVDPEAASDLSAIVILENAGGERIIFHNRDSNERLRIEGDRLRGAEWVFVSSLNGDWEAKIRDVYDAAGRYGVRIAFNPGQHNLRANPDLILEKISETGILVLNKDEAIELLLVSGRETDRHRLENEAFLLSGLVDVGADIVAVTDGLRGAWVSDGTRSYHADAVPVERPKDTTGAGDAFAAAFFAGVACFGADLSEAIRFGIAESASVVTEYGTTAGQLSLADLRLRSESVGVIRLD
jgi:sugar/nucleoside kinase (ribokinase family)